MQTKPKRNSVVTTQLLENGLIQFTVIGQEPFTFDRTKAAQTSRDRAEVHGWIQRHSDAAAMSRDEATGKPATPAEKRARMIRLRDHYESGSDQWALSGGGVGQQSIVILAVQRVMNLATYEMAADHMVRYGEAHPDKGDMKVYFAGMKSVNAAILAIQAERLAKPVLDADAEADALSAE